MQTQSRKELLQSLIKSGIHWGHERSRRNPKMEPYIWGQKNNVTLIDVSKTAFNLEKAAQFLQSIAGHGKNILWVGTKKPAKSFVRDIAIKFKMPYVTHRWIGGTLSNYAQVKKSVTKLLHYEDVLSKADQYSHYTKKELNVIGKSVERLLNNVGGIRSLKWPIGALVVIDITKERAAIKEANQMGIPVVALVDTNADPSTIDYVIPGNDDAPRAISYVLSYLADFVEKGVQEAAERKNAQDLEQDIQEMEEATELNLFEPEDEEGGSKRSKGSVGLKKAVSKEAVSAPRKKAFRPRALGAKKTVPTKK